MKFVDPNGEDIEVRIQWTGNFTDKEKDKIIAAITKYLGGLKVGKVLVRDAGAVDNRTLGQKVEDATMRYKMPFGLGHDQGSIGFTNADLTEGGQTTDPRHFRAKDLEGLRNTNPVSFIAKMADGILHEILAHELRFGFSDDHYRFNVFEGTELQKADTYVQSRKGTLMDSMQARTGNFTSIRPLYPDDQKKIEERLQPIHRKYKD